MLYLLKRFKNCLLVCIFPVLIMNTVHGYGQSIQQTNEQNQSVITIAHSEASLFQLKQQVRIGGISLNRDPITMAPFEVKTNIVSDDYGERIEVCLSLFLGLRCTTVNYRSSRSS